MKKTKNKVKITQKEIDLISFEYTNGKIKVEDSFEYCHLLQNKWAKDLGLTSEKDLNYKQQEVFRKLYCIWKWKIEAEKEINDLYFNLGILLTEIAEKESECDKLFYQIAKTKNYMRKESKLENYDLIANLMCGIIKFECDVETYKSELLKTAHQNEEFVKAYVINNDSLYSMIKNTRFLLGKSV